MKKSYFLRALIVFATLTASPGGKVSVATANGINALKHVIKKNALTAFVHSFAAVVVCLALAVCSIVIWARANSNQSAPAPELRFDDSIIAIFDNPNIGYTRRGQFIRGHNPNGDQWQCFPWLDRPRPAISIQSVEDKPNSTFLVLPKGHYVEHQLSGQSPLVDGPDVDFAIQFWNWGDLPEVYLVDEDQKQHRIFPVKFRGSYPHGFKAMGFDLTQAKPPFKSRTIRLVGVDNAGPYGGCGIGNIAAYAEDFKP
jgi:hypothetical protein